MSGNNHNIWEYDNLSINDDGRVVGSAYTFEYGNGKTIQIGVFSYTYEKNGEFHMNHVPNVVVTDSDGSIVMEPHARDSENPQQAIDNAREKARNIYKNERYA